MPPLQGRVVAGDPLSCQREVCAAVLAGGGDYLSFAKDNQPGLVADIRAGLANQEQAWRAAAAFSPRRGRRPAAWTRGPGGSSGGRRGGRPS